MRRALLSVAVAALVSTHPSVAHAASSPEPLVAAAAERPSVLVLGDSTVAAASWYDGLGVTNAVANLSAEFDTDFDTESCRRLTGRSCTGFDRVTGQRYVPPTVVAEIGLRAGQDYDALVVMAGYDDVTIDSGVDAVMSAASAAGIEQVLWATFRTTTEYILPGKIPAAGLFEKHNAVLRAKALQYPNLVLADWDAHTQDDCNQPRTGAGLPGSRGQTTTTSCWLWWDGIHLTPNGAEEVTRWMADELRLILSAACWGSARTGAPLPLPTASTSAVTSAGLLPMAPTRVLDTRTVAPIGAGSQVRIDLSSATATTATAVAVNLTTVDSCGAGYLTAYRCDSSRPGTSSANFTTGRTLATFTLAALSTDRTLCVFSSVATHLVVDLVGQFAPGGSGFRTIAPTRLVDTRTTSRLSAGVPLIVDASAVAPGANAAWVSVTAVDPAGDGYVSVHPCASPPSATSTVNFSTRTGPERVLANTSIAPIAAGQFCVTASAATDVLVDVLGSFGGTGTLMLSTGEASRLTDTRETLTRAKVAAGEAISIGRGASVDVLTFTMVDPEGSGFGSLIACGASPTTSVLNVSAGVTRAVTSVASGGTAGACAHVSTRSHVVVDLVGTFN